MLQYMILVKKIQLKILNQGRFPLKKIDIFVNDVYLGTSEAPFNFSFIPGELENLRDENSIKIISYDNAFNRGESVSNFSLSNISR